MSKISVTKVDAKNRSSQKPSQKSGKNIVKKTGYGITVGLRHIGDTIIDGFKTFDGEIKKVATKPTGLVGDLFGNVDL